METQKHSRQWWKVGGSVAGLVTLLVILVAVNVIVAGIPLRRDLTEDRLYTLSDGTRHLLKTLNDPVTLKFFFNGSAPEMPVPLKTFARQVEDLLREYRRAGGGRIVLETYDPKPDSDDEEWAQRYGLAGQPLGLGGSVLYLGVVAVCGDRQAAIPVIDPRTEELLEYNLTRLIYRVSVARKPVVGVMSPLPVLGREAMPFMMPGQPRPEPRPPWVAFQDLRQDYEVREIPVTAESIEEDVAAVMLVHPKNLSDRTLYALDQFVLRGGRLAAFLDPLCVVDEEGGGQPYGMPMRSSDLGKLLTGWGVAYDPGKLVADLGAATPVRGRGGRVEQSPVYLSLRADNLNARDVLTTSLESLVMPLAGAFTWEGKGDVTATPLITTSEDSALTDAFMAQMDADAIRRGFKSGMKPLNLALRLQGKFATAFPGGKPPAAGEPGEATNDTAAAESATNAPGLLQSVEAGTVVLVGDVDMLHNQFAVQELNFFGYSGYQPLNDNVNFLANLVEQIAGSADLIGIRCRGRSARPFARVVALERAAQERWLEEERRLEERLQTTQQRLNELQSQKDEKQRYILSPDQRREMDRFRQEVLNYRRQLKEVRRNLREGIERLGVKVKVVNVLFVPALVALVGVGFSVYRRSRTVA